MSIKTAVVDGVATIEIARPEKKNAITRAMYTQLAVAFDAARGVPPEIMGIGPIEAIPAALRYANLKLDDLGWIELNEAFAAQALAVIDTVKLDRTKVNPMGGAIALGHPLGATGAILTVKALHELERTGGRRGLVTMCIGGGQGIALAIERLG